MKLKWNQVRKRLVEIFSYARQGGDVASVFTLAMLGVARGHPFSGPDTISRLGRSIYPTMRIRAARFGGQAVLLNPAELTHAVIAEEFLIDNLYDLDRITFQPSLILDCGAHVGMFTCLAASRFPGTKIVAFEPAPQNLRYLKEQEPCRRGGVEVVEAAVSDRDGTMSFVNTVSLGGRLTADAGAADTYEVKVVDLGTFIRARGVGESLVLKMDIEGEEENVLPAIVDLLPPVCAIYIEVHGGRASWDRVRVLLAPRGFTTCLDREHDVYIDGFALRQP